MKLKGKLILVDTGSGSKMHFAVDGEGLPEERSGMPYLLHEVVGRHLGLTQFHYGPMEFLAAVADSARQGSVLAGYEVTIEITTPRKKSKK